MCSAAVARQAAIYPLQLCKAILQGIRNQTRHDGRWCIGMVGMGPRPGEQMADAQFERRLRRLMINEGYEITEEDPRVNPAADCRGGDSRRLPGASGH